MPLFLNEKMNVLTPFSDEDIIVARLAESLALACGMSSDRARLIRDASALHDIGKILIPKSILLKPGRLLPEEFEIMKTHTVLGVCILSSLRGEFRTVAMNISALHHEKWDGTGYWSYRKDKIPFYCQIAAMCDIYVALTMKRSYKEAWPPIEAYNYVKNESGKSFCPDLVEIFQTLFSQGVLADLH